MQASERRELTDLLQTYLTEEGELSQEIVKTGQIPEEITERSRCSTLKYITELSEEQHQLVESFLDWTDVAGVNEPDVQLALSESVDGKPAVQVGTDPGLKILHDRNVIQFFDELHNQRGFPSICDHLSIEDDKETLLKNARLLIKENKDRIRRNTIGLSAKLENDDKYQITELAAFACDDCVEEENQAKCDCLSFDGVIYDDSSCYWRRGLFKKVAEQRGLEIRDIAQGQGYQSYFTFFLPELDALVTKRRFDGTEFLDKIDPSVIVVFGQKEKLLDMLEYDRDILVVSKDEESFYYFDSDRVLEDSDSDLIGRIVEDLDDYAEQKRGKEHTRIQSALLDIGEEEGYITQEEYTVSGLTVDAIWFKREGREAKLAAEVETTGGWKKDILSMWETEPDIALLITTNHKTDKVAKDLARFSVVEYAPYTLVYANLKTRNVYAFKEGQVLGKFELGEDIGEELEEGADFDIENL